MKKCSNHDSVDNKVDTTLSNYVERIFLNFVKTLSGDSSENSKSSGSELDSRPEVPGFKSHQKFCFLFSSFL